MINLVSYPRSGNTFVRNVLYEVYGIPSAMFWLDGRGSDEGFEYFPVVKTHHLPHELSDALRSRKTVLLLRDGRDSVVSLAHHRKDIVAKGSDFQTNLNEAIEAAEGSYFGGWSLHTECWLRHSDLVIRFEDLVRDPIGQCERMRALMELPPPRTEKLPDFKSLKAGEPQYGAGKGTGGENIAQFSFRRGKINGWKDEMTTAQHERFWHLHGEVMEVVGYSRDGGAATPSSLYDEQLKPKAGQAKKRVLIEASKVREPFMDGIKRYVVGLLRAAETWPFADMEVMAMVEGRIVSVGEALAMDGGLAPGMKSFSLRWLKDVLRVVLPNRVFQMLARLASQVRLRRKPSLPASAVGQPPFDIVHLTLPQHYAHIAHVRATRVVATIHDLTHWMFPEYHQGNNIRLTTEGMDWLKTQKADLIAVSQQTADDLAAVGLRARAVPEGVSRRHFFPLRNEHVKDLVRERYNLPKGNFLLSVCTLEPRKNLKNLLAAYALLPEEVRATFPLVLVGRKGWKIDADLVPVHCRANVRFTGFVVEKYLPALYNMASAFCYISHYEGFGLPVLEAMACGCPVVAAGNSAMRETVGNAGLLVDPNDVEAIHSTLADICASPELRQSLSEKSLHQCRQFTWTKCWKETARRYTEFS